MLRGTRAHFFFLFLNVDTPTSSVHGTRLATTNAGRKLARAFIALRQIGRERSCRDAYRRRRLRFQRSPTTNGWPARREPYFAPRTLERTPGRLFAGPRNPGASFARGWPEAGRAGRSDDAFKASRQRVALRDALSAPGGKKTTPSSAVWRAAARNNAESNERSVAAAGTLSKRVVETDALQIALAALVAVCFVLCARCFSRPLLPPRAYLDWSSPLPHH
ncbi:hypothetical protein HPB50_027441 [Hyalomma asiaticum]|uniref:Uncharacterized protein n=1 Tax=Hyalomma asiaticum TaxID=266040 RepID=A0ACB7TPK8_HYAAI|nr:hypothetical protein HPB50_027441 [Hyalomma asiaticum]